MSYRLEPEPSALPKWAAAPGNMWGARGKWPTSVAGYQRLTINSR
jgi:hypothetical protein